MEIRPLQIGDLFTIARMIKKARVDKMPSASNLGEAWLPLAESLFSEAPDDLLAWLADLAGKEVREFEVMPAEGVLDIIKQLASQEDSKDFLFWLLFTLRPGGREKLVKVCDILRRKYGLAADEAPFSDFAQVLRELIESRQKEVEDTLAEAEEILTLARGEGK